jgi:hypothetical protein
MLQDAVKDLNERPKLNRPELEAIIGSCRDHRLLA